MKLSVLIPTYNYDCTALIRALAEQLRENVDEDVDVDENQNKNQNENWVGEILVADDASTDLTTKEENRRCCESVGVRFIGLEQNVGRAAIRNLLAKEAQGEWLLFIDCDAAVTSSSYITNYLKASGKADVLCGGTSAACSLTPEQEEKCSLRLLYERTFWNKRTSDDRQQRPYDAFTTFNFMIRRSTFLNTRFDERLKGYGHEDTLFGIALKEKGALLLHIDNPLMHMGVDENEAFLRKTEEQLRSLYSLRQTLKEHYTLLIIYARIERLHLTWALRLLMRLFGKSICKNLVGIRPNLRLFQLYKLGFYAEIAQENKV